MTTYPTFPAIPFLGPWRWEVEKADTETGIARINLQMGLVRERQVIVGRRGGLSRKKIWDTEEYTEWVTEKWTVIKPAVHSVEVYYERAARLIEDYRATLLAPNYSGIYNKDGHREV